MAERKLYKVNVYLPFSSLDLPWNSYDPQGNVKPLRLEDPPLDGPAMIGFMPIFGTEEAAEAWCNGRWSVDVLTLNQPAPVVEPKPAYAGVRLPPVADQAVPEPDNTIKLNPRSGRRRRK